MGIDCIEMDIEACHRHRSKVVPKPTIIQTKRAIVDQIFEKRKKLAEVAIRVELPERTKIYIPIMSQIERPCIQFYTIVDV